MLHTPHPLEPWNVDPSEFPHHGTTEEKLRYLLNFAVLAPSTHNTQPWLWKIEGNEVALYADRSRAMPALDPDGRELLMSCGAALQHLRLAMRAFGYTDIISILPNASQNDLLAHVRLSRYRTAASGASGIDEVLFSVIPERRTTRQPFQDRALPQELLDSLQDEAQREGAWLQIFPRGAQTAVIADLIAEGDIIQGQNRDIRHDLADWISIDSEYRSDGVPSQALGFNGLVATFAPWTERHINSGTSKALRDSHLAETAPVIAVLGTELEGPRHWLNAGQALARVLLRARASHVSASFFSQPIQVDELWSQLRRVIGTVGFPQLIFRLGYADPVEPTPRRAADEVTL